VSLSATPEDHRRGTNAQYQLEAGRNCRIDDEEQGRRATPETGAAGAGGLPGALFFDLVFVFAFTRVSQQLLAALTSHRRALLTDAGETLLLLLALLMVWFATAWITDLYDSRRPEVQLVVAGSMFGSLLMAVALPRAFGSGGLAFAAAYFAIHIGRGLVLVPALRGHEAQRRAAGVLLWFAVSAVPWIVGAVLQGSPRWALWTWR
jgi:low temperature requirement protein LtrA